MCIDEKRDRAVREMVIHQSSRTDFCQSVCLGMRLCVHTCVCVHLAIEILVSSCTPSNQADVTQAEERDQTFSAP